LGYYPVVIEVKGANALVVGGVKIAQRKAMVLLKSGARVTLISPKVTNLLDGLAKRTKLKWLKRKVSKDDIAKARIVIAATNDGLVNKNVSFWSKKQGALVNIVNNPSLSSFISPAVFKKSNLIVAVNSNGKDPELSRDLKNYIKEQWGEFLSYRRRLQKRAS